ncbi:zinc finger matrin-type protein 5-like [Glandiceps talaboti]
MGKRYYCDYCDKTFPDNPQNRKKHLNGIQHQLAAKSHYDQFKDPAIKIKEEAQKNPCRRFQQTGFCNFGVSCRYSHMTPESLEALEREIEHRKIQKLNKRKRRLAKLDEGFSLDDWLAKKLKKKETKESKTESTTSTDADDITFTLPPELQGVPNLPPSILPPPQGGYQVTETAEWGW